MRRAGLAGLQQRQQQKAAEIGKAMRAERTEHIKEQLQTFRKHLEEFADKHRAQINKDPEFRKQFVRMAKTVGVDPLASSKGFWAETLGLGSFYFDLAVQVADVCISTRSLNGGLISMDELLQRVRRMRGSVAGTVTEDDVRRALTKLAALGDGYSVVTVAGKPYVLSVPSDLSNDSSDVLQQAAAGGESWTSVTILCSRQGWAPDRAERALQTLLKDGLAWLDTGAAASARDWRYYFPSILLSGAGSAGGLDGAGSLSPATPATGGAGTPSAAAR